jgi:acyl dehydratase
VNTPAGPSEGLTTDVAGLLAHAGESLGHTAWRRLSQEQVDQFADLTEDHNFIHVDPDRAAQTPFGSTIVHGYFTVAMLAPFIGELLQLEDASMAVNYGMDKLRFPAPVPVGAEFRASGELTEASEIKGGVEVKLTMTIEVKDAPKPALVAECRMRYYA